MKFPPRNGSIEDHNSTTEEDEEEIDDDEEGTLQISAWKISNFKISLQFFECVHYDTNPITHCGCS